MRMVGYSRLSHHQPRDFVYISPPAERRLITLSVLNYAAQPSGTRQQRRNCAFLLLGLSIPVLGTIGNLRPYAGRDTLRAAGHHLHASVGLFAIGVSRGGPCAGGIDSLWVQI